MKGVMQEEREFNSTYAAVIQDYENRKVRG